MNHINAFLVASTILAISSVTVAAPTEVDVTVPAGASETQIASFQTPAGAVSSEVVVGRFLIDYSAPVSTADEIVVQVQTHDLTQARFKWAAVTLNEPLSLGSLEDLNKSPAAADRVIADLFVNEVPAAEIATAVTHRLIEVRVLFSSAYTFNSGPHTWKIRVFGLPRKCTGDSVTVCDVDADCTPTPGGVRCNMTPSVRYTGFYEEDTDLAAARAAVTQPKISISPATLAFGQVQINLAQELTPRLKFTWTSVGTDVFTPSGNLSEGVPMPFHLHGSPAFVALKPGETSLEADIGFGPTAPGPVARTLEIRGTVNSASEDVGSAELNGTGIAPIAPPSPPSNVR